jgi:hypothetical protein
MELKFSEEHFKEISLRVEFNKASNYQEVAAFDIMDTKYAMYDQYCKNVNCDCTGASIEIVKVTDTGLDTSVVLAFDFDYEKNQILEAYSHLPDGFEEALITLPGFLEIIKNRSAFVKNSFEIARKKREIALLTKAIGNAAKVPRNAPCPCESGRKYKNCCGK